MTNFAYLIGFDGLSILKHLHWNYICNITFVLKASGYCTRSRGKRLHVALQVATFKLGCVSENSVDLHIVWLLCFSQTLVLSSNIKLKQQNCKIKLNYCV